MARIIDCQRQIEESRKTVDLQVPLVVASSFAAYAQPDQHNTHTTSNSVQPRLSKFSLPKFRGDITRWQSFWDSFKSAIHENSNISIIDKFNYLNSLLEGNTARTVQGLILTSSNYNAAVQRSMEVFSFRSFVSRLPSDVRLQISRSVRMKLLDTIKSEIDAREASEGVKSSGIENHKPPINPKHNNRSIPTSANALVAKGPKE